MTSNTDYLRFSAYSLKELITRKLASETKFTDQVYKGSNLAILIDIVCYMYLCLLYNVNNAAAEAMWSDTLVYENINRLSKLIGYNPKGCIAATATFTLDNKNRYVCVLPKYTAIDTGITDENGKKIYYSTNTETSINKQLETSVLFYNGIWKLYNTAFIGTDEKYQTLILDLMTSDSSKNTYVLNDMIHVYIKDKDSDRYEQWTATTTNLFLNPNDNNTIYSQNSKVYNVRLNENKQYEITFGNGFIGKKPTKGAQINIFYLDSNCPSAELTPNCVSGQKIKHDPSLFGISKAMYNDIFFAGKEPEIENTSFIELKDSGEWTNTTSSTTTLPEETVEEIRVNAPQWSKIGNRLVTSNDWEYYIKNTFKDNILDVKCQNNWQYISTFYSWLYNLGIKQHDNPEYYLSKGRILKYDYEWADAADTNNVYLWIKMKNDATLYKSIINNNVQSIKLITEEPVYLNALNVAFSFCAEDVDSVKLQLKGQNHEFDLEYKNYLEITVDDNTLYANSDILSQIIVVIKDFFNENNFTLGSIVNTNDLANKILNIGSITRIRTVFKDNDTGLEIIQPGISFATWTTGYIDIGDDVEVSTIAKSLEVFLFPRLYKSNDLSLRIKIIRKTINQINAVQY